MGGTRRHDVPRAKGSLAEETWSAAALPKTTRPRMPRALGRAQWAGFGDSAGPSQRPL